MAALTTLDGSVGRLSATFLADQCRRSLRHGPLADLCFELLKTVSLIHLIEGLTGRVRALHQNPLSVINGLNPAAPGGYCGSPKEHRRTDQAHHGYGHKGDFPVVLVHGTIFVSTP